MWKRIDDEMPEMNQHVLCYGKNSYSSGRMAVMYWDVLGKKPYWNTAGVGGYEWETELEPTHWQPLPHAPE